MNNNSLYLRFNILIVGTIFILGLFMGSLVMYTTSQFLEDELDSMGNEVAISLGAILSNDILVDDKFAISDRLMKTKNSNDQIRYIIVCYPDGSILASTFSEGLPEGLPKVRKAVSGKKIDTISFSSNEGRIREVMYPIDDGIVGSLRVGMSEKQVTQRMQERLIQILVLMLFICIVASIMATRYAWNYLQPIRRMAIAVRKLGTGDYDVRIPVRTTDDVGRMGMAFNDMIEKLQAKEQENFNLVKALEKKEKSRIWLINQMFSAREDERRRISSELHDETGQSMVSILAYLRLLQDKLTTDEQKEFLKEVRTLTQMTLEGLRRLALDLHPPMLEDLGLKVSIEKFVDTYRETQNITVDLELQGNFDRVPHNEALICYRTLQEGLTNIAKHSGADHADIKIHVKGRSLRMTIRDNGVGFDNEKAEKAKQNRHLGLVSMRERVELLNGVFHIEGAPGRGTGIAVVIPLSDIETEEKISFNVHENNSEQPERVIEDKESN